MTIFWRWLGVILLTLAVSGCASQPPPPPEPPPAPPLHSAAEAYRLLEKRVPEMAAHYEGIEYRMGANPDLSDQTDCSNLVCAVVRRSLQGSGYTLQPHYMYTGSIKENSHAITAAAARPGDVVFFKPSGRSQKRHHVGIITRRQGDILYFSHASSSEGVVETHTASQSWKSYWSHYLDSYRRWNPQVFASSKGAERK